MTTHEHEITAAVDLADADGKLLNPAARGWSRLPLHRANLRGSWGRTKKWDYWAILAGDLVISGVYADVDYLGTTDITWFDLVEGTRGGRGHGTPDSRGIELPEISGRAPLQFSSRNFTIDAHDDDSGNTHISARWNEKDGRPGSLDCVINLPPGHESMSVVIPWTAKRFQFTTKHQARPAHGTLVVGDRMWMFGNPGEEVTDGDAWGVVDIGRGRWPYDTNWNWGGGAGRTADGHVIGLQFGGKWTVGTGFTENALIVDGRVHKIGRELDWSYEWDDVMRPWRVTDPGGQVDMTLTPRYDKYDKLELKVMRRETHQVFGTWDGHVIDDEGVRHGVTGFQGFAEESRAKW